MKMTKTVTVDAARRAAALKVEAVQLLATEDPVEDVHEQRVKALAWIAEFLDADAPEREDF